MKSAARLHIMAWLVLPSLAGCGDGDSSTGPPDGGTEPDPGVRLELVSDDFQRPVHLTAPAGDDRLFVVEQAGRIRIFEDGEVRSTPFLDIRQRVSSEGERGLLSLAFHPHYEGNGRFFVYLTDPDGDSRVEEWTVSGDPNVADPTSASLVLGVEQPFANHNGGLLLFDPDGLLLVGLGDGGDAGDPGNNGQDPHTLLGSLLRLDVDGGDPYGIPPDNPFADGDGGRPEVWAYGLRNPWRYAIDRPTGLLYVADVGQSDWEEVNVGAVDEPGLNYGWNVMEGTHCFRPSSGCDETGLTLPVLEYSHAEGCSITGGVVYRGEAVPALQGRYLYADLCEGWIRSFRFADGEATDVVEHVSGGIGSPVSFGTDGSGEVYVMTAEGGVYRFTGSGS